VERKGGGGGRGLLYYCSGRGSFLNLLLLRILYTPIIIMITKLTSARAYHTAINTQFVKNKLNSYTTVIFESKYQIDDYTKMLT